MIESNQLICGDAIAEMRDIPNFPDYAITKDGRVWSKSRKSLRGNERGNWLKPFLTGKGYYTVALYRNKKRYCRKVHRLVLETFRENCPKGMQGRHLNDDKEDNSIDNLAWGTCKENIADSISNGKHVLAHHKGEAHSQSKLKEQEVRLIFSVYHDGASSLRNLAKAFGVSYWTVRDIIQKRRWGHLWQS
jgi:hypothetical protein